MEEAAGIRYLQTINIVKHRPFISFSNSSSEDEVVLDSIC